MAKSAPGEVKANRSGSSLVTLIVGAACLVAGVGIGYYWGNQSTRTEQIPAAQAQTSVPDPAAFLQNETSLKAAYAANPKDLDAIVRLGNLYYDASRFKDAVEWYGRALDLDSGNVDVRTDRGTSYWNLGLADSAIAEFQKALVLNPTHPQTLYNLGVVYLNGKNNSQEARKAWEKLLATNPNYPDRAKVQQELASLSNPSPSMPASKPQAGSSEGVQDLLERLKQRQ